MVVGRGKILLVAGSGNQTARFEAGTFDSFVCSSTLTNCHEVETPVDLFCAGHVLLPDGRALVGGEPCPTGNPADDRRTSTESAPESRRLTCH